MQHPAVPSLVLCYKHLLLEKDYYTERNNVLPKCSHIWSEFSETKIPYISGLSCKRDPGKNIWSLTVKLAWVLEAGIFTQWRKRRFWFNVKMVPLAEGHSGAIAQLQAGENCAWQMHGFAALWGYLSAWNLQKGDQVVNVFFYKWTQWSFFTGIQNWGSVILNLRQKKSKWKLTHMRRCPEIMTQEI